MTPAHAYMHRNSPLVRGFKVPTVLGDTGLDDNKGMEVINGRRDDSGPCGVRLIRGAGTPVLGSRRGRRQIHLRHNICPTNPV